MKTNSIFIIGWIIVSAMVFHPGIAFSELKSLDDAELASVEAEGATVNDTNNQVDAGENSGIVAVATDDSDPFNLNDPNRKTNVFSPPALNQNIYAAPKSQFNNLSQSANCCTSGAPMPGCH
jgi:hypothetical protein